MKHPLQITLIIVLIITLLSLLLWFGTLGQRRAATVGNGASNAIIYVIITASMAFLGETLLSRLVPVWLLHRHAAHLKRCIKTERPKVERARREIIQIEETIFGYRESAAMKRAAHRIAYDHAKAPPCSK